jgi:hypothetical protein
LESTHAVTFTVTVAVRALEVTSPSNSLAEAEARCEITTYGAVVVERFERDNSAVAVTALWVAVVVPVRAVNV